MTLNKDAKAVCSAIGCLKPDTASLVLRGFFTSSTLTPLAQMGCQSGGDCKLIPHDAVVWVCVFQAVLHHILDKADCLGTSDQ